MQMQREVGKTLRRCQKTNEGMMCLNIFSTDEVLTLLFIVPATVVF